MKRLLGLSLSLFVYVCLLPVSVEAVTCNESDLEQTVYVSTADEILKVNLCQDATVEIVSPPVSENFTIGDVVFGPDGNLYAAAVDAGSGLIVRVDPENSYSTDTVSTGTATSPEGPSFLGFDLYFNSEDGIYRLENIANVSIGGTIPSGTLDLVFSHSNLSRQGTALGLAGELLFVESNDVWSSVPDAEDDPPYSSATELISNLGGPIGIATSAPVSKIFVAENEDRTIHRCDFSNNQESNCGTFFTFDSPDSPQYMEIDLAGRLFVVTSCEGECESDPSKVWIIEDQSGVGAAILEAPLDDGETFIDTAVGLALPPTSRSDTHTFNSTEIFNCGSSKLEITMDASCTLTIDCQEVLPAPTNASFSGEADGGLCTQYDWNGGFCVQYVADDGCMGETADDFYIAYLKFNDPPNRFPAVAHSDGTPVTPNEPPVEDFNETLDNPTYYSVAATLPDDAGRGGGGADFSTHIAVDLPLDPSVDGGGSVSYKGELAKTQPPKKNSGATIPIKACLKNESEGPVNGAEIFVSIYRFLPDFERMTVESAGNSNVGNLMRPNGPGCYMYNLKTTGYPSGTYQIGLSSTKMPGGINEDKTFIIK